MTYEESVKRLEEIVARLEEPGVPLEEAIALYKEGTQLSADCKKLLEGAAQQMQVTSMPEVSDE